MRRRHVVEKLRKRFLLVGLGKGARGLFEVACVVSSLDPSVSAIYITNADGPGERQLFTMQRWTHPHATHPDAYVEAIVTFARKHSR